ncbi:MAG: hypothetical protein KKH32_08180 [Bacteroidetes bacterium]|nr:hypothetical protein [Bacteroidota bacterium]
MKKFNITAIGEILFDIYPTYNRVGGAPFNFIYHIKKLTGNGYFISRIGEDELGSEIVRIIKENDFKLELIQIDTIHPTGTAQVQLSENKIPQFTLGLNCAYEFIEYNEEIESHVNILTDLIYFGTLAQRNEHSRKTIRSLWGKDIKYFCDLNLRKNFYNKEIMHSSLVNSHVLKLNSDELKVINETLLGSSFNLENISLLLMKKFNIELLCVTLGENGAFLRNRDSVHYYKSEVENLIDTVGAGDAYASVLCTGYLENWKLDTINIIASEFAGEICAIKGALPKDDEIYKKYRERIINENEK